MLIMIRGSRRPAYTAQHPAVLFDEAHFNLHRADGLYMPFVSLIANDGYRGDAQQESVLTGRRSSHRTRFWSSPTAQGGPRLPDAADAAFSAAECQAVDAWIKEGGSLLLITDHHPWGAAAQPLAKRLGVGMSQGQTLDPDNAFPRRPSQLIFARENDLLGDHPIIWGRGPVEQLGRVVTYSGQSLKTAPARKHQLSSRLADSAMDRSSVDNSFVPGRRPKPGGCLYSRQGSGRGAWRGGCSLGPVHAREYTFLHERRRDRQPPALIEHPALAVGIDSRRSPCRQEGRCATVVRPD